MNSSTEAFSMFYIVFCGFYILALALTAIMISFWLWMFIDLMKRGNLEFGDPKDKNLKIIWFAIMIFPWWLGAIMYYFFVYRKYPRKK